MMHSNHVTQQFPNFFAGDSFDLLGLLLWLTTRTTILYIVYVGVFFMRVLWFPVHGQGVLSIPLHETTCISTILAYFNL